MSCNEELNVKEREAIEELGICMKDVLPVNMIGDTSLLRRFLIARDFDVRKAEKMLRKNILWRKSFQVDTILEDFKCKECISNLVKLSYIGLDKEGDMVKYNPPGKIDCKNLLDCVKLNEYMRHWIYYFEEDMSLMKRLTEETGRETTCFNYIMDLNKLTFSNATYKRAADAFMRFVRIAQDNYPERLKAIYIINAPSYYIFIFSHVKTFMSKASLKKIHVFGSSGWKEKLLEVIDADVLPAFLGGNRTDPDGNPLCSTFISHGGTLPEMYYLSNEERYFKDRSLVKQVLVPPRGKIEIPVDVTEHGSFIQWEFLLKGKDIGFGLSYKTSEQDMEQMLPIQRIDTIDGTEEGSYKCKSIGKYVIIFDNTYSWMNSKEIEYCITVVKPEL